MSWQKYAVVTAFFPVILGLSACADATKKYRDTSELERPPQLEIAKSTSDSATENPVDNETKSVTEAKSDTETKANVTKHIAKGLGEVVKIEDDSHLIIDRPFAESWLLVAKGLRISNMEVADRNLEKGQYYVVFDPDLADIKNGEKPGFMDTLFMDDENPKARYLLTFYENKRSVKLSVEFLEYFSTGVQAESKLPDKGVEKLLKKLYTALHDDLPVN